MRSNDKDVRDLADQLFTDVLLGLVKFKNPEFQEHLEPMIDELLKKKGVTK